MKKMLFILFLLLFLSACTNEENPPIRKECAKNADCMKAGCSSQICTAEEKAHGIITTCEYKPEYECYQKATCGCGEGRCVWEDEGEVNKCVKEKQAGTF